MKSILCVPCWVAALALAAWVAASSHWYVCVLKNLCDSGMRMAPVATVPVSNSNDITPASTWADISAKPLVVYFAANSDRMLTTDIAAKLADIVSYLKANPTSQILVTGHTNVHSSQSYTDALGLTRANAAKSELVALGVDSGQILTESKGQRQLAASPKTAEGRYLNRRVVISVVK
jgi:outer membrane protein OmpA-like peptidoglycan-associated protein